MPQLYLFQYNICLFFLWLFVLYLVILSAFVRKRGNVAVWNDVEWVLKGAQTAAVLEVVHSALGWVRSPLAVTAMQVASRLWVLWGVVDLAPGAVAGAVAVASVGGMQLQLNVVSLLLAWSLTEVIRYLFFACKCVVDRPPYLLTWLRYSAFLPLYPLGVASELSMVWLALPAIRASRPWSLDMPNALNMAVDYPLLCLLAVAAYLPGLPKLYCYMLAQRRKVLAAAAAPQPPSARSSMKDD